MIRIVIIPNSFDPKKNRIIKEIEWEGKKLSEYIPHYLNNPIVALNQLHVEDFDVIVPDNSEIIITPKQEGSIIGAVAGWIYTAFTGGAIVGIGATGFTTGMLLSYVAAAAVVMAGSMLLSSVLSPSQSPNSASQSIEESPTYSWSPTQTLPRAGSPIPILYGKHALAGNIIQRRIEYIDDDEYLYMQLALCMGEIENLTSDNIYINDTLISDFDDVEYFYTNGTSDQDVMTYFGDIESPNSFYVTLEDTAITRQTVGNASEALRLFIQFPNGLYYSNNSGGLDERTVEFKVEYKKTSSDTWLLLEQNDTRFLNYEYENATRTFTPDEGERGYTYVCTEPYTWDTTKKECYTGNIREIYETDLFPTWKFSGAKTTPINKSIRIDNLEADEYDVRITRLTEVSTDARESTTSNWVGIGEIVKDDIAYPNVALLGVKIKATGQLSGDVNLSIIAERKTIEVFNEDGVSQGQKRLDNPAWIYYDALTNEVYGYGLAYSRIDYNSIEEWAEWCDELVGNGFEVAEKRALFNGVFDYEGNLWDALTSICTVGRASPIIKGTKYSVIVDKPSEMVQIFNMGNIKKSTLKISYIGEEELANEVEIQFVNKDNDYTNDTISVVVPEWFDDTQIKKSIIQQMGITNASQAYRAGRYFLNCNKHIKRTAEFEASIDAIDCEAGDVVGISHDVPAWGESGRLVSALPSSVTLDKEVSLEDAQEYEITVRLEDNTFEKFDIVFSGNQTTDTITIDGTFTQTPNKYDVYSLIEKPYGINLFRINSITRKTDQTRKITAVEYNESIVNDSTTIIDIPSASELNTTITSLVCSEHLEKKQDGTVVTFIDFAWTVNAQSPLKAEISLYKGGMYIKEIVTDLKSLYYKLNAFDLEEGKTYTFRLKIKDSLSVIQDYKDITHTVLGKTASPTAVTNIKANWSNGSIVISWDKNNELDFSKYEIDISGQIYQTSTNTLTVSDLNVGIYTIKAYAIDTTNNKSEVTIYTLNVSIPCMIYMIRDAYLIEKAFIDGTMTIYTSATPPPTPNKYDIWKVDVSILTIDEFTFHTEILQDISWNVGSGVELYKYYNGENWLLCTTEQTAVVRRMLGQLTTAGITDNEVKVYNVEPFTPYEINDLWINGRDIYMCTISRATGNYDALDWTLQTREDITIASKIENIRS